MQWAESARLFTGQTRKAVVTFQQRVVRKQRGLARGQFRGSQLACLGKGQFAVEPMQLLEPVGHPQALAVDGVDGAPVHGRGAGPHHLVDAIAEADALDE